MSKTAIGTALRLSARCDARATQDLVARETGNPRDDHAVCDEELEWEAGHVRFDRVAACHSLERRDRGLCPIARIQRGKTASAERGKKLVHVLIEDGVGFDFELHDLRTA